MKREVPSRETMVVSILLACCTLPDKACPCVPDRSEKRNGKPLKEVERLMKTKGLGTSRVTERANTADFGTSSSLRRPGDQRGRLCAHRSGSRRPPLSSNDK